MIRSMTAFARQEADTPWGGLIWELRTVNHRYLDIGLRLPDELRALEPRVREAIGGHLARGKVDGALRFQSQEEATVTFDLDTDLVRHLGEAARKIHDLTVDVSPLRTIDVLRWPEVLKVPEVDIETLTESALALLAQTLASLVEMRAREGARLQELIRQRLDAMAQTVEDVQKILPETIEAFRTRLLDKLQEVRQQLDPGRLEQEVVLFAQRSDVAEELDRLTAHIGEARRVLKGSGQVGRRLDFLMQEFNREANTLASKAVDIRMTNAAVELKVLIEQMREQVQNIE
jgi:uncharacterized protein (TIGR00255 family)